MNKQETLSTQDMLELMLDYGCTLRLYEKDCARILRKGKQIRYYDPTSFNRHHTLDVFISNVFSDLITVENHMLRLSSLLRGIEFESVRFQLHDILHIISESSRYGLDDKYPKEFEVIDEYRDYLESINSTSVSLYSVFLDAGFDIDSETVLKDCEDALTFCEIYKNSKNIETFLSTVSNSSKNLLEVYRILDVAQFILIPKEYHDLVLSKYPNYRDNIPLIHAIEEEMVKLEIAKLDEEREKERNRITVSRKKTRKEEYHEYLQTDHWKKVRLEALERANHHCQVCNKDFPLHVHHNSYEHLGNEQPHELIVLCASCHDLFHKNKKLSSP